MIIKRQWNELKKEQQQKFLQIIDKSYQNNIYPSENDIDNFLKKKDIIGE